MFCRLKSEGKFKGHEKQFVLIDNEQFVGFFDHEDDTNDVETHPQSALQRVESSDDIVKKYTYKSKVTSLDTKVEHLLWMLENRGIDKPNISKNEEEDEVEMKWDKDLNVLVIE